MSRKPILTGVIAVGVVALAVALYAFNHHQSAANDFQREMNQSSEVLRKFKTEYPRIETDVEPLRAKDPARAARELEARMLPLLDDTANALARASASGDAYLTTADPEPAGIRHNVEVWKRLAAAYRTVRVTYEDEIRRLRAGKLDEAAAGELAKRRVEALSTAMR